MDTYEASASDCITMQPPLLNSRKPHHRTLRSRKSNHYKRLHASWRRRRTKRIRQSDFPDLSSSDEYDLPPPITQSGFPNPNFLAYMPRPSDIVPATGEGSASDAGFDENARKIHHRRVEATRIMLASIDSHGNVTPVPHWRRNRSGLSKYTAFMHPPQEDKNLPDLRVPLPLMSRFYRGTLLANHRVGRPAKRPKMNKYSTTSPEASAFECEYLGSTSNSDFDARTPQMLAKEEPLEIDGDGPAPASPVEESIKDTVRDETGFSKTAFLEELEQVAAGSSDGLSEGEIGRIQKAGLTERVEPSEGAKEEETEVPAKPKSPVKHATEEPDDDIEIVPEKKSEIDLLREMLSKNPEMLLEDKKPLDKEALVETAVGKEEEPVEVGDDESKLTPFQKEKRIAMMFSHSTTKRPRPTSGDMVAKYLNPSKRRKDDDEFGDVDGVNNNGGKDSRMNLTFTMKLMNKMGFTGRLGKKEDGRKNPVLPIRRSFRSGLGSQSVQTLAGRGDHSLLPTKFTGKAQRNGTTVGHSDEPHVAGDGVGVNGVQTSRAQNGAMESGDVYTTRRKRRASEAERDSRPNDQSPATRVQNDVVEPVEEATKRALDGDDIYETDAEDDGIDNGRRAILIDFDVLIKDSAKRRLGAIRRMLDNASLTLNVEKLLEKEQRDLCDDELLRKVLGFANVKPTNMAGFDEKWDEAFESLPPPELDHDLLDMLRQYSKDVHFGIFHRGSRRRMQCELNATGLANSFLQEVCTTVKHEEKWPYLDTWQDLMCRVGVGPRQCLYILSEAREIACKGDKKPSTGVLAGSCLGVQTAVWQKDDEEIKLYIRGPMREDQEEKISVSCVYREGKKVFDGLLKDRMPALKRRRVIAQYEDDLLWYSAVVQYEGGKDGKCWVKFNKFENTDWVCDEDLVPLSRKDYGKMKKLDFPGLIDSDTSVL